MSDREFPGYLREWGYTPDGHRKRVNPKIHLMRRYRTKAAPEGTPGFDLDALDFYERAGVESLICELIDPATEAPTGVIMYAFLRDFLNGATVEEYDYKDHRRPETCGPQKFNRKVWATFDPRQGDLFHG